MSTDCLFCQIISGDIPCHQIYEDDHWLAFLDINPVNLGHSLLIPKQHAKDLLTIDQESLQSFGQVLKLLSEKIITATNADGLNLMMNNGQAAGQMVDHAHCHLIPRYHQDGFHHWPGKKSIGQDTLKTIGEKIRQQSI